MLFIPFMLSLLFSPSLREAGLTEAEKEEDDEIPPIDRGELDLDSDRDTILPVDKERLATQLPAWAAAGMQEYGCGKVLTKINVYGDQYQRKYTLMADVSESLDG
eukprot:GHVU01048819.1.p2 GENE.GHVU01048819.1~~GHVU01048819.1.p2  ORF type:complete len:105 (+),score=27.50 GHVU01048819.1:551-865(+)